MESSVHEMLELIKILPKLEIKEKSHLEVIGVSHRETIMANILGYYFKPKEMHGLGNLFIRALLNTLPRKLGVQQPLENLPFDINDFEKSTLLPQDKFMTAKVKLEVPTKENKRIDIVISTDELVIVIEFKINHDLNNSLHQYVNHIKENYPEKKYYFIVLTPTWKEPIGSALKESETESEFLQILLSPFIKEIEVLEKEEGIIIEGAQKIYYLDFIKTIKNRKRNINMINEFIDLVEKDNKVSQDIEDAFKNLLIIKDDIDIKMNAFKKQLNLNTFILPSSKGKLESVLVYKADTYQIKMRLNLKGWHMEQCDKDGESNREVKESFDYNKNMGELKNRFNLLRDSLVL